MLPAVTLGIIVRVDKPAHLNIQARAVHQGLSHFLQFVLFCGAQTCRAVCEADVAEVLFTSTDQGSEQGEWRGGCLDQEVLDDCPDHPADAELRVVQAAVHRYVEVNLAIAVLE